VRAEPQVGNCTTYVKVNNPGCSAKFTAPGTALDASASAGKSRGGAVGKLAVQAAGEVDAKQKQSTPLVGLLHFLIGSRG
jgi:hypothetical protein